MRSWGIRIIITINIIMFGVNLIAGGGSFFGLFISGGGYAKEYGEVSYRLLFEQHQWWRLLSCGYLHIGIFHLLCNVFALQMLEGKAEACLGTAKLAVFYHLGIICTSFLWCLIFKNGSIVGASLGIYVLMGILFVQYLSDSEKGRYFLPKAAKRYLLCYIVVGCLLGIGTIVVHLIGFVVGMVFGTGMLFIEKRIK